MEQIFVNNSYDYLKDWVDSLSSVFDKEGKSVFKKRNEVKVFCVNGEKLAVKKYKKPNFFQSLSYSFFRDSKAKRAFCYAQKFENLGIKTPVPIAYIECKSPCGMFTDSYFVSCFCDWKDSSFLKTETNEELEKALASFIVRLHDNGIMHGDLNLTNILWNKRENGSYEFSVIDLNRTKFLDSPTSKDMINNMARLSHDRGVIDRIIRPYAEVRGWDKDETVRNVIDKVTQFEERKRRLGIIKSIFKK